MDKKNKFDFNTNWYELWMKQSREFFSTAEKSLHDMFGTETLANPEENMDKIRQWQEMLKSQWSFLKLDEQQKAYENYWKTMGKMCNDACDMMVAVWIKRNQENKPVKNVHELYELWLNCCNEIYSKSMQTKNFQDVYGEFMNAALKYWKSSMPK